MSLHNAALVNALIQHPAESSVVATTPHGTYEFDIVNVEGDPYGDPVLRLVEVNGPSTPDTDCTYGGVTFHPALLAEVQSWASKEGAVPTKYKAAGLLYAALSDPNIVRYDVLEQIAVQVWRNRNTILKEQT